MRKGISLPIETTIVMILAVIVLVALLFFFTGTFNPGAERIRLEQQKVDFCTRYASEDTSCKASPKNVNIRNNLTDICGRLGLSTEAAECCSNFCPQPPPAATPVPTL